MTGPALQALLSHWWRNPWQLLTLIVGLALATALWSGVQAINTEARASYAAAADRLVRAQVDQIQRLDGRDLRLSDYIALRRAGWQVSPILEGSIGTPGASLWLLGIEPLTLRQGGLEGLDNASEHFESNAEQLIVHPDDAALAVGFGLPLLTRPEQRRGLVLADISTAERLLQHPGSISRLLLHDPQPFGIHDLPPTYIRQQAEEENDVAQLTGSFHLNLTAFGLLSFAVGIFIVYGAVGLAFEQRRGVFRTLRAVGVSLRVLMALLIVELATFALIAGAIGVALGYVIAGALLPDVAATLRGLYGAEVTGQLSLRPIWWLSGLAMAFAGTAIAAVAAMVRLYRLPILAGAHPQAMVMDTGRIATVLASLSGLLVIATVLLLIFGQGLIAAFTLLGCLLLASALILPALLGLGLRLASHLSRSVIAQWFWADTRQQLPGLSMALMALLLAMATNIGVSTMVSSFRLTFTGYLDQRLASELYIRAQTEAQAEQMLAFLDQQADAVLPLLNEDGRIGGIPTEFYGIIDHETYRAHWPLLDAVPGVWDLLAAGQGVIINEQLFHRRGWRPGDFLPGGDRVLGIYRDYGNPEGQVIMGEAIFRERYPEVRPLRFGLRSESPDKLAVALRDRFALGPDALIDQADLKASSLAVFERTFAVTTALNLLTLGVAGLAILISLLTLATMRLPQLAPIWALGLTRRHLAGLEMIRAVALAAATGLLAIPLGLALAWVLLAVVNVEAFGWRLPMFLFPAEYLRLGMLTLLAAVLAALWPAVRLSRTPPATLLRTFSNER